MEARDLRLAAEFCTLVDTVHLFEYLGLDRDCPVGEAQEALARKRKYMQSMQNNPKFKDSAKFLIQNYRALDRVMAEPVAHLKAMAEAREASSLPTLVLVLDGILADGRVTTAEETVCRRIAGELGISQARFEAVLAERVEATGAIVEAAGTPRGPAVQGEVIGVEAVAEGQTARMLRGASGHGWWDAAFTRMLLETIPGGPGELVDVYCRTALSALTLLPDRRQLSYLGVDKSSERLRLARTELAAQSQQHAVDRITLVVGEPHQLPIADCSVDFVLAIRALANLSDTRPVFAEAVRVLRPGGRLIVAEPDGFAECFHFDSHLVAYNHAFHGLIVAADAVQGAAVPPMGRPGVAIGPTLLARMKHAGLSPKKVRTHASNNLRPLPFGRLVRQLKKYPVAIAQNAGLSDSAELSAVMTAIEALQARIPQDQVGMAGHVLPLFLAVGVKE